ncbi:hypothetical protein CQW23_31238 [Capsicum baccatum]|uniref:Protein TAR1 n=1 Tax=Capsicum baccatum TaxID=33114 RepID=A0A2G2V874_CAPBA|nr:hypothetical protein CQW23_31238 [Capsicum baccatum]
MYRCEPLPEFPLASPRSGIVHHLSGPDRLLGPCFKMGRMGIAQASVRSAQMPKHAGGARCLPQSRRRGSTSISRAQALASPPIEAGPFPESIGRPAHRRSTSFLGRIACPHLLPS